MNVKQQNRQGSGGEEGLSALLTNAQAIMVIAQAVEGTLGPKGLDTMLLDQFGDVIITNDGVTILEMMDVNHPAARMLINLAKAQQEEIGDGTTTATILAGALVNEGVNQIRKGVPVVKVIEGMSLGIKKAIQALEEKAIPLISSNQSLLFKTAKVAARGNEDIADLVIKATSFLGQEKLGEPSFKLAENIRAVVGSQNQVISGVIIDKEPVNPEMPKKLKIVKVLVIDDALEPEEIEDGALRTEAGFTRYLKLQEEFRQNIEKVVRLGVGLVLVDRGIHDVAEEIFTDAGVLVLQRVSNCELRQAAEFTGAKLLKRTGLKKEEKDLKQSLGEAAEVYVEEKLKHVRLLGGKGEAQATVLVSASTEEVVEERERIAKDAASAVQAAVKGGVVPGGGTVELAIARELQATRQKAVGMAVYGVDCVCEALKKPFTQIVNNAGFNPLEKLGEVIAAQIEQDKNSLGINCDSGEIIDIQELGIYDPVLVKKQALQTAMEVATAILRIETIIKKKEMGSSNSLQQEGI
ncbi:MAG TPA: chaperonin [Clostridia bacterium]|jgi:chaperonin GroEL (HSP60 family)|nr:chaperonin [Clostridia bacterium]